MLECQELRSKEPTTSKELYLMGESKSKFDFIRHSVGIFSSLYRRPCKGRRYTQSCSSHSQRVHLKKDEKIDDELFHRD